MTYQELLSLLDQNKRAYSGVVPSSIRAPSIGEIISGISSQYQPVGGYTPDASMLGGASRYLSSQPSFGVTDVIPEYGRAVQAAGPSFVPSAFDKSIYENVDTKKLSNLISQLDSGSNFQFDAGGFADSGSPNTSPSGPNVSMTPEGPVANTIDPTIGQVLGFVLGQVTGVPFMSTLGKMAIQQQNFNAQQAAMFSAIAQADTTNPANLTGITTQAATPTAPGGPQGTGGAAAAAAASAASAAAAAGHSAAAIGAASQAAADATIGGASPSAAAAAAADAANAAAADAADADGGGLGGLGGIGGLGGGSAGASVGGVGAGNAGGGIGAGEGLATGGKVSKRHLAGPNPTGPDDGYAALKLGEYVIKQSSVDKYGTEIFDRINQGKISKKAMNSLL